ncbi:MAG: hypothetical protein KKA07_11595, partial [Bacteroidetes bacterium]|nr:hypothetical protein [Bacteroidota bacterium]
MLKRALIAGFLTLIIGAAGFAQTPFELISTGGTKTHCGWDLFDSGGEGGAYGNNQNFTQTWVSSSAAPNT